MNKSPCLNCKDREPGCHSKCDEYINWKIKKEQERKQRKTANEYSAYRKDVKK